MDGRERQDKQRGAKDDLPGGTSKVKEGENLLQWSLSGMSELMSRGLFS